MTDEPTARERGNELLHVLAGLFPPDSGVVEGPMFSGIGLSVDGRFFAFVSHAGALGVKLPEAVVAELVGTGRAQPMTMGRRTMRQWASVPQPANGEAKDWFDVAVHARSFVQDGSSRDR